MDGYMHQAPRCIGGGSKRSKHHLMIDQSVAKDAQSRRKNLAMALIDYKTAYNSVPHSWTLEFLKLYKIDPRLVTFIRQSMSHWRTTLSANSKSIADVTAKCGIYQGDDQSPLLFCLALNPLSALLAKALMDTGSKVVPLATTSSTWTKSSYMPKISRISTH